MNNQYIWLHNNKDKYEYVTEEAKKVHAELNDIVVSDAGQISDDELNKLKDCYDRFVEMFNNNPFLYKNALKESDIETSDFDCYFINVNGQMLPVGYYKINRRVESVVLLSEKIEKQEQNAHDVKDRLTVMLKADSEKIAKRVQRMNKAKKANYFRAILATAAWLIIVWSSFVFFKTANIITIVKSIFDGRGFENAVTDEMLKMPILSDAGVGGWIGLLTVHIFLIIVIFKCIKSIKKEYILSFEKNTAFRQSASILRTVEKLDYCFDANIENDKKVLSELARQGENGNIAKNPIAKSLNKIRHDSKVTEEYFEKDFLLLRGIKSNRSIVFLVIIAALSYFSYNLMADESFRNEYDKIIYEMKVDYDQFGLRGKKIVQLTAESCPVYARASDASKVKYTLPIWTEAELVKKKVVGEEEWSEIKKITDSEIIEGWVPTAFTSPYNEVDYSNYKELGIYDVGASSYLIGENAKYVPELAVDWDYQTSWQDGNVDLNGKGEYISLRFSEKSTVNFIQIIPGNVKREDLYWKNERIKKARIEFSNGEFITYEFDDIYTGSFQTIWLNKPVETSGIDMEILETYAGEEYNDLCISEMHAYGPLE